MAKPSSTSAPDKPRYKYKPLNDCDEIRLLQLHADPKSPHVSCEVHHVRLSMNLPPYHALSYVWGSPDKDFIVSCETGKTYIPVTKSLHAALRAMGDPDSAYDFKHGAMQDLPKPDKSPLYWADGICINQDDVDERNQQVTLMGDIYRNAHRVITYISEGNEQQWMGILLGVNLQQYVNKRYPHPPDPRIKDMDRLEELGFPHQSDPQWRYLRDVLHLPWSSRMWIVQETLLNQNIVMKCGGLQFPWSVLGEMSVLASRGYIPFLAITDEVSPHVGLPASVPASMDTMTRLRRQAMTGDHKLGSLRLLLSECQHLKSTDPRDKVYALTNIAKDWTALGIVPNYNRAVEELYTEVALRIMRLEKSLTILAAVYSSKALTNLPSWVPDWSTNAAELNLPISGEVKENGIYAASGTTSAKIEYNEVSRVFWVAGAFIDKIEFVTEVIGTSQFRRKPQWFEDMLRTVQEGSSNALELGGSESSIEALWRTLIANFAAMEGLKLDVEASACYGSYFKAFVRLQAALAGMEKGIDYSVTQIEYERALAFDRALTQRVNHRSLCRTERGFLGLVPEGTRSGDDICILLGGRTPYILKRSGNTTRFAGEAYIHGLMKGQGMRQVQSGLEMIEINA